jgi:hypothetical protein
MCGPSGQESAIAGSQQKFSNLLQSNYSQNFGNQSAILGHLSSILTPIAEAGPNQEGFSAAEKAELNSSAISSTAASYKHSAQVVGEARGAAGGGNDLATSGADKQVDATLASNADTNLSNQQNQIDLADYSAGRQQFNTAVSGLGGVAQEYAPTALAGAADTATSSAFNDANAIQQQKNQEESDIAGGIAGIGLGVVTGGMSGLAGSAAGASQPGAFLKGALGGG